jgi:hypothetical protein
LQRESKRQKQRLKTNKKPLKEMRTFKNKMKI